MKQDTSRIWEPLFRHALDILDSAPANAGGVEPDWSVGGGTMLMRRYRHRESRDVDIFLGDPQWISVLTPRLNTVAESKTSEYVEQAGFLKLYFADGEVDFIAAGNVTDRPFVVETVLGRSVRVETDAEIIGKKVRYRAARFRARDLFDLACVIEKNPAALGAVDGILAAAKPVILARLDEREPVLREDFQAIAMLEYTPPLRRGERTMPGLTPIMTSVSPFRRRKSRSGSRPSAGATETMDARSSQARTAS